MQYATTITDKGQMTIPVVIRRKLNLKPGRAQVRISGSSIKIEQTNWREDLERLQAKVRQHMKKHGLRPLSDEELDKAINEAAEQGATENYLRKYGNR